MGRGGSFLHVLGTSASEAIHCDRNALVQSRLQSMDRNRRYNFQWQDIACMTSKLRRVAIRTVKR